MSSSESTIDGIVFDLDGTLVASAPAIMAVGNEFLESLSLPPLDLGETISYIGGGSERFVALMLEARGAHSKENFDELFGSFMAIYNAASPELNHPFEGVEEALVALRARGLRLAMCTNKPTRPAEKVLEAMGWSAHFDALVAGDTLAVKKPDPAPLFEAARRMGCEHIIYVGDSETDAETARRAELPFLLFTEGYRKSAPEELPHRATFSHYRELVGLVESLIS